MKKIMFNDKYGLTQAVLERRKTQTRRLVQDEFFTLQWDVRDDTLVVENDWGDFIDIKDTKFCMFKIGETVSVAQSYKDCGGLMEDGTPRWDFIAQVVGGKNRGWSNKMFVKADLMPHQIRITDVRVEKLQDISEDDCLKEGVVVNEPEIKGGINMYYPCEYLRSCAKEVGWGRVFHTHREAFAELINRVSRKDVWSLNPYVFVYDFELLK